MASQEDSEKFARLLSRLGDDSDRKQSREQENFPGCCPLLTLRVGMVTLASIRSRCFFAKLHQQQMLLLVGIVMPFLLQAHTLRK
jgi:hypothetical protein